MTLSSSSSSRCLARQARAELARRAVLAGLEALVAPAALAAARHQQFHAGLRQVAELLAGLAVAHDGARRHVDQCCPAAATGHVAAAARLAVLGAEGAHDAKVRQRVDAVLGAQRDAAAVAAIAAIRSAEGHELLAAEAHAAAAAVAGLDPDSCFVDEFHGDCTSPGANKKPGA